MQCLATLISMFLGLQCVLHAQVAPRTQKLTRARDLGIRIGDLEPGPTNSIVDVEGVAVGHFTLKNEPRVHTGITIVHPCLGENLFHSKVPAAVFTANGFGKAAGFTQVRELGTLEAPLALTSTLAVGTVLGGMVRHLINQDTMQRVRSINVVVGETNDGYLNDIRSLPILEEHVALALANLSKDQVVEGNVGAGTGTRCFGYKGGIGSSSRRLRLPGLAPITIGVLVQSNFGGNLRVNGIRVRDEKRAEVRDGSCMIIVATDAPVLSRNLERLAKRATLALGRMGSNMANGSGDYAIAFSTHRDNRMASGATIHSLKSLANRTMTPLFEATVDATEEAILNSMVAARSAKGHRGNVKAIDHALLRKVAKRR